MLSDSILGIPASGEQSKLLWNSSTCPDCSDFLLESGKKLSVLFMLFRTFHAFSGAPLLPGLDEKCTERSRLAEERACNFSTVIVFGVLMFPDPCG